MKKLSHIARSLSVTTLLTTLALAPACVPPEPEGSATGGEEATAGATNGATEEEAAESALTAEEVEHLVFLREEEKLARDVYLHLYELWGVPVFANIASSEQTHTDRVLALLGTYGIEDPVGTSPRGVFRDETLQALHDELVAWGARSELDAFLVGGLIEETDITDLLASLEATSHADIATTYERLMAGSENHLRAFASQVESTTGAAYAAQALPAEDVAAILAD